MTSIFEWFASIFAIIGTFQVKDIIDIICITAVVYGALKLVKETRAEQLLKGVLILIVIYFFSHTFELMMLTQLLDNFFQYGVIIIFIIFQPEIRKALEQIGRSKISKSFVFPTQHREDINDIAVIKKTISHVCDSCVIFQRSRTGALIVFERTSKLGDIAETGTILNADSSVSIIGNLFFNKSPLHDGAVIIQGSKIKAAGCILPLTRNEDVDVNLGTRHRAALGMSEESDAVVVVVSEETGSISLAYKGRLTRDYDRNTLQQRLENLLLPQDKTDLTELIPIFSSKKRRNNNE